MKKLLILMIVALTAMTANAQKGAMSMGGSLSLATDNSALGVGARFQYNITDPVRLNWEMNYFPEKSHQKSWMINVDAQYLVRLGQRFTLYPLAGVNYSNWEVKAGGISISDGKIGVNMGAGLQYEVIPTMSFFLESKAQFISHRDQSLFTFGVLFPLR